MAMGRHLWLAVSVGCSAIATTGLALGGHVAAWEFYTWVWTSAAWSFNWWMAKGSVQ